jgi:hypothetical protein
MYVSTRNVWYFVSSAQIRSSGLLLGLPLLLFLICMSFKSGISFIITFMLLRFLVPNLLLLVKISVLLTYCYTCILLPFILLWPSIKAYFLPPFLDATVVISRDRSSMFIINPEVLCCIIHKNRYKTTTLAILKNGPNRNCSILVEGFKFSWLISDSCNKAIQKYPCDIREFIIFIFPYTVDTSLHFTSLHFTPLHSTSLHFTPLHFLCRSQTVLKEPYFGGISYPSIHLHPSIYIHPSTSTQKDIHTRSYWWYSSYHQP